MEYPKVNLALMWSIFAQQERLGLRYIYGGKYESLDASPGTVAGVDCSGEFRYLLAKATDGKWIAPDGSQNQREYFERSSLHQLHGYTDVIYADPSRLFVCFIRPFHRGCGAVGHVFMVNRLRHGDKPVTIESHGGGGCTSRPWDTPVLVRECYSVFELPTLGRSE